MAGLYWEEDENAFLPASNKNPVVSKSTAKEPEPEQPQANERASLKITVSPRRPAGDDNPFGLGSPKREAGSGEIPFDLPVSPMSDASYSFALPPGGKLSDFKRQGSAGRNNGKSPRHEARAFKKELERAKRQSAYESAKAKTENRRQAALINRQRALNVPTSSKPPAPGMLTSEDLEVGAVVVLKKRGLGIVRYKGPIHCDQEKTNIWLGVELKSPDGKNDGTVQEQKYFSCKPKHGVFVRAVKRKIDPGELLAKIAKLKKENDKIAELKKELRNTRREFEEYKTEVENHEQRLLEICYPLLNKRGAGALVGQLQATGAVTSEIILSPVNPSVRPAGHSRRHSKSGYR